MRLVVNGEPCEVTARDIAELVASLGLPREAALVEHNGTALRRSEWPEHGLAEGDRIEIIRIVAGG